MPGEVRSIDRDLGRDVKAGLLGVVPGGMPMAQLVLSAEEEQVLERILRRSLSDLDLEILHTDHAEFKAMLKQRRAIVQKIHQQLPAASEKSG